MRSSASLVPDFLLPGHFDSPGCGFLGTVTQLPYLIPTIPNPMCILLSSLSCLSTLEYLFLGLLQPRGSGLVSAPSALLLGPHLALETQTPCSSTERSSHLRASVLHWAEPPTPGDQCPPSDSDGAILSLKLCGISSIPCKENSSSSTCS